MAETNDEGLALESALTEASASPRKRFLASSPSFFESRARPLRPLVALAWGSRW